MNQTDADGRTLTFPDYLDALPKHPYWSDNKRFYPNQFAPRKEAVKHPYIQHNFSGTQCVHFDVDRINKVQDEEDFEESAMNAVYKLGLQEPAFLIVNQENGHEQAVYQFADPIPIHPSRVTQRMFKDVILGKYRNAFDADKVIYRTKQLAKNVLHPKWRVVEVGPPKTTLSDMAYAARDLRVGLTKTDDRRILRLPVDERLVFENFIGIGRNCTLFDYGRHYAYAVVADHDSMKSLLKAVLAYLLEANQTKIPFFFGTKEPTGSLSDLATVMTAAKSIQTAKTMGRDSLPLANLVKKRPTGPLPLAEVTATANSIAKWTYARKHYFTRLASGKETIAEYLVRENGGRIPKDEFCQKFLQERRRRQSEGRIEAAARQGEARRASVMRQVEAGVPPKQIAINEGCKVRWVFQIISESR